jgi:hypothetical protein
MNYKGTIVTGDFEENTLTIEMDNPVILKAGEYMVIPIEEFKQQIIDAGNSCALKQHLHNDRVNKMTESEIRQFAEEKHLTFGEQYYNETFNE